MNVSVEVRPNGSKGPLIVPLNIVAEPHTVARALGDVLKETAQYLVDGWENSYANRMNEVRFAVRVDVDCTPTSSHK